MNDKGLAVLYVLYKHIVFLAVSPFTPSPAPIQLSCDESNVKVLFLRTQFTIEQERNCLSLTILILFFNKLFRTLIQGMDSLKHHPTAIVLIHHTYSWSLTLVLLWCAKISTIPCIGIHPHKFSVSINMFQLV